jgi:hypothetical protein
MQYNLYIRAFTFRRTEYKNSIKSALIVYFYIFNAPAGSCKNIKQMYFNVSFILRRIRIRYKNPITLPIGIVIRSEIK